MVTTQIEVQRAEWLKPGYMFALRRGGGYQISRVNVPRAEMALFVRTVLDIIECCAKTPDITAVSLSPEDCALVSEMEPERFRRIGR